MDGAQGASFGIEELDVVAGADVAFAYALLRCDTPAGHAADPDNRLRLTLGLRKRDGRWIVTREHHSFPHNAPEPGTGLDTEPGTEPGTESGTEPGTEP